MEELNIEGASFVGCGPNPPPLTPSVFKKEIDSGATVVDTRPPPSFGAGHIKGSYSISTKRLGLAGWVLPYDKPILLVIADQNHLQYVSHNLIRLGYDNLAGYLAGSIATWYMEVLPIEKLELMTAVDLKNKLDKGEEWDILDVRSKEEWAEGHIKGSVNIYVGLLEAQLSKIPRGTPLAVVCKSGTRSSFACSILRREGWKNLSNVLGGMSAWNRAGYPTTK
jgi:hydroxyacylglutathione hydrolase